MWPIKMSVLKLDFNNSPSAMSESQNSCANCSGDFPVQLVSSVLMHCVAFLFLKTVFLCSWICWCTYLLRVIVDSINIKVDDNVSSR